MNLSEEQFQTIVNNRLALCSKLLTEKGKEYVRNGDRLHNFRSVAQRRGVTMLEVSDGMFEKHLQSYYDMISDVKAGLKIDQKFIDDKITDLINYLLLDECIIVEHNQNL